MNSPEIKTRMKIWFGTIIVFLGILWVFSPVIGLSNDLGEEIAYIKVQSSIERLNLAYDRIRALERYEEKQQKEDQSNKKYVMGFVTCYTNLPEITDASPDITASGEKVRIGGVAANGYKFGTRVQIEGYTYTINDRKNSRYGPEWFDIFVESYQEAVNCGVKELDVVVIDQ